eukprot:gene6391-6623_t
MLNPAQDTTEAFLALPVESLGSDYIANAWGNYPSDSRLYGYLQVMATDVQAVTNITVTTLGPTNLGGPAGTYQISLTARNSYTILAAGLSGDISGTRLSASVPFAVNSGHRCGFVPDGPCGGCNSLIEMVPPTTAWGKGFLMAAFWQVDPALGNSSCATNPNQRLRGDIVKVVASQDGTQLQLNGLPIGPALNASQAYTVVLPAFTTPTDYYAAYLASNKPIQVMQLMEGAHARMALNYVKGDPAMAVVPPVEQWVNANIVTIKDSMGLFMVANLHYIGPNPDGVLVNGTRYSDLPAALCFGINGAACTWRNSTASDMQGHAFTARMSLAAATTTVFSHANPGENLAVIVYGMEQFDAASWPAAMAVEDLMNDQPRCPPHGLPVGGINSSNILGYSTAICNSSSYAEGAMCLATCTAGTRGGFATCTRSPAGGIWVATDCLSADPFAVAGSLTMTCTGIFDSTVSQLQLRLIMKATQSGCDDLATMRVAYTTINFTSCCLTVPPAAPAFPAFGGTGAKCQECKGLALPYTVRTDGLPAPLLANDGTTCNSSVPGKITGATVAIGCVSPTLMAFNVTAPAFSQLSFQYLVRCIQKNMLLCPDDFLTVRTLMRRPKFYNLQESNSAPAGYSLSWQLPVDTRSCDCSSLAVSLSVTGTFVGIC